MKESPHIIAEEKAKQDTIQGIIFATIVVFGMLSVLIYGMALLSSTKKVSEDVYGAKHLENRIELLESEYREHTHVYSTGKPNKPKEFQWQILQ